MNLVGFGCGKEVFETYLAYFVGICLNRSRLKIATQKTPPPPGGREWNPKPCDDIKGFWKFKLDVRYLRGNIFVLAILWYHSWLVASCTIVAVVFPRYSFRGVMLTTHPLLAPRQWLRWSYTNAFSSVFLSMSWDELYVTVFYWGLC
jgi:hypothetical protein